VQGARNVLVLGFLLPYICIVGIVLSFYTVSVPHLIVHLVVVGLISVLTLQVVTFMDPELPFSRPPQKGRSSGRMFSIMFVIGIGTVLLPIAGPLIYRTTTGIVVLVATLAGLSLLIDRLTKLRIEAQAERLEFEG
jgi:MFS family permease